MIITITNPIVMPLCYSDKGPQHCPPVSNQLPPHCPPGALGHPPTEMNLGSPPGTVA